VSLAWSFVAAPRPTNDNLANAQSLGAAANSVTGSNINGTLETNEPSHGGVSGIASVWFRWSPSVSGEATFDTLGSGFDTLLAVYKPGTSGWNNLQLVAQNDDATSGTHSRVTFSCRVGTEYHIALAGKNASGAYTLNWSVTPGVPVIASIDPHVGKTGATVTIAGDYLESATSVTFNGVAANFSVAANAPRGGTIPVLQHHEAASSSMLSAVVPTGATTGKIAVTTPNGTAQTASDFIIDNTAPATAVVTAPSSSGYLAALGTVSGTATDNTGGSGIKRVEITVRRLVNGAYEHWGLDTSNNTWGWSSQVRTLDCSVAQPNQISTTWSCSVGLPAGNDLPDGSYYLAPIAYDRAGNVRRGSSVTVRVDVNAPSAAVLSHTADATLGAIGTVSGSASDGTGSGISRVDVILRRSVNSTWEYWGLNASTNVYGWSTTSQVMKASLSAPNALTTNWSCSSNWPTGGNLNDGTYYVHARVFDRSGRNAYTPSVRFKVDVSAPSSVLINTPANNTWQKVLTSITGSAADSGSGIDKVEVSLRRPSGTGTWLYWGLNTTTSTYEWANVTRYIAATVTSPGATSTNWSCTANLPTGANLPNDIYYLNARAIDKVGKNLLSATRTVKLDSDAPSTLVISNLVHGQTYSSLPVVEGQAATGTFGIITRVDLSLRRQVNGVWQHWGRNTSTGVYEWSTTSRMLATVLSAPNTATTNWSCNTLPSGANLANNTYHYLYAIAYDGAGNTKQTANTRITIASTGTAPAASAPGSATSTVRLSTARTSAATNSVTLVFTAPLDAATATDAQRYQVVVNGQALTAESASYDNTKNSVVLGLPEGALAAGDEVVVEWQGLNDTAGASFDGKTAVLKAQ
jgi:hypothetical protein